MQDAFGGIVNIFLILIFLIIVEGVLAFAVSYTKAFKMKNYVISTIEQYEASGCFSNDDTACMKKIKDGASTLAYKPTVLQCHNGLESVNNLFCADVDGDSCAKAGENSKTNRCYRIVTQVDINLPIINRIMGISFFQVTGDTRPISVNYD